MNRHWKNKNALLFGSSLNRSAFLFYASPQSFLRKDVFEPLSLRVFEFSRLKAPHFAIKPYT